MQTKTYGVKMVINTKENKDVIFDAVQSVLDEHGEPGIVGLISEMSRDEIESAEKEFITITSK